MISKMLNLRLSNIYIINMESQKKFVSVVTHSVALVVGIFIGVIYSKLQKSNQLKTKNNLVQLTIDDVPLCDVFDNNGNPMITNFFISKDNKYYTILFEEMQNNINFVITLGGVEVANIDNFNGKEYKFEYQHTV